MRLARWVALAGVLVSSLAQAAPDAEYPSPLANPVVSLDGGISGFLDPDLRSFVRDGEMWGVRVSTGGFEDVRIEVAYIGTRQGLDPSAGGSIISHGVYGVLRINVAPWGGVLGPFLFQGGGWSRYHVRDHALGSPIEASDNVLHIPFGLGLAKRVGGFLFDVRLGIETASGADLMPIPRAPSSSKSASSMERYSATALVGFEL